MVTQKSRLARRRGLVFKGRSFGSADVQLIGELSAICRNLSRQELAKTVCELLDWRRPNGGLKTWECRELLERLAADGEIELPALRETKRRGTRTRVPRTARGERRPPIVGTVREVAPVALRRVEVQEDRLLWRELVGRYHYLGHKVPFGAHLRYLITLTCPEPRVAGCLQVSSPAWKMAPRDAWIGWSDEQRKRNLQRIVNNSRFLILPWVEVQNLASTVLSLMARQVPGDWTDAYAQRPLLFETLVDVKRFRGTCYQAANWILVGETTGRGRMDRYSRRRGAAVKSIYLYPLHRHARQRLRSAS